nr:hypothetical protein B0A51_10806 [Rachicladosporium sp. CCFEE 5018]
MAGSNNKTIIIMRRQASKKQAPPQRSANPSGAEHLNSRQHVAQHQTSAGHGSVHASSSTASERALDAITCPPTPPSSQPSPSISPAPSLALTRLHYTKGDILWVPVHDTSDTTNPSNKQKQNLTMTPHGQVYSTHRMAIVLLPFASTLICLPFYTWSDRGIGSRDLSARDEYVGVKNVGDFYINEGIYRPLEVSCIKTILPATTIQLTAPLKIERRLRFGWVGRLKESEWEYLLG